MTPNLPVKKLTQKEQADFQWSKRLKHKPLHSHASQLKIFIKVLFVINKKASNAETMNIYRQISVST